MALSEFEKVRINRLLAAYIESRRPPPSLRSKVDTAYRLEGQSFVIYNIRPVWNDPERNHEEHIAKATYVKARKTWKLYWMRADLKWHGYDPLRESRTLERVLQEIEADPYGCFWG